MKFRTKKEDALVLMGVLNNSQEYIKRVTYNSDKVEIVEFKSEEVSYIFYTFDGQLVKYEYYMNGDMTEIFVK